MYVTARVLHNDATQYDESVAVMQIMMFAHANDIETMVSGTGPELGRIVGTNFNEQTA